MLDPSTSARPALTLVEEIVRDVVAPVRAELHLDIGDFPYRLFLVVRRWSGGEAGRGDRVTTRTELGCGRTDAGEVGPAKVTLGGSWSPSIRGVVPDGQAIVEQLDGTYTEAQIVPIGRAEAGDEVFYEIAQDDRDGSAPDRPVRRYRAASVARGRTALDWTLTLASQEPSAPFANAQLGEDGGTP